MLGAGNAMIKNIQTLSHKVVMTNCVKVPKGEVTNTLTQCYNCNCVQEGFSEVLISKQRCLSEGWGGVSRKMNKGEVQQTISKPNLKIH